MAYNNAIPQSTDNLSQSQADLLANFLAIDSGTTGAGIGFSRNHVTMTDATNGGTHKVIDMLTVSAPSAPTDPASVWYTKAGATSGNVFTSRSIPYFRNQTGEFALIPNLLTSASASGNNKGFTWGQLIINFGRGAIAQGASTETVTWTVPFTTAVYSLICSKDGDGIGSSANSLTINGKTSGLTQGIFTSQTTLTSGNMPYYYLVIGY